MSESALGDLADQHQGYVTNCDEHYTATKQDMVNQREMLVGQAGDAHQDYLLGLATHADHGADHFASKVKSATAYRDVIRGVKSQLSNIADAAQPEWDQAVKSRVPGAVAAVVAKYQPEVASVMSAAWGDLAEAPAPTPPPPPPPKHPTIQQVDNTPNTQPSGPPSPIDMLLPGAPASNPDAASGPRSWQDMLLPPGAAAPDPAAASGPRSWQDMLLPPGPAAAAGSAPGKGFPPFTKADAATAAAGAVAGGTADGVRQTTLNLIKESPGTGPGKASPTLLKWLEDANIGGYDLKGFSRIGGVVGAASALPAVISDIGVDHNSVPEALTREAAGTGAGLWTGGLAGAFAAAGTDALTGAAIGSAIPGAGTAVGLVVGAVVGAGAALGASKAIEWLWDQ
jgi:hypothetical protein